MSLKPELGSQWVHRNSGQLYEVYDFTNEHSTKPDFIASISYRRLSDDTRWSRPLSDWHRSFIILSNR